MKPNFVIWDDRYPFPKYGVITTASVLEEVVACLKDHGISRITIGEGMVHSRDFGGGFDALIAGMKLHLLKDRYGVRLVDFNRGRYEEVDFGEFRLKIAEEALRADAIVSLPVLKTHNNTKISLGFKNLKGCLHLRSKQFCHHPEISLHHFICLLAEKLAPKLTVIDGIYSLERGPGVNGTAHKMGAIIASSDPLAADVAGAYILGFDPEEVDHLAEYAMRHGTSASIESVEVVGKAPDSFRKPHRYDFVWNEADTGPPLFDRLGIKGISYPKYDVTLCSTCSLMNNMVLIMIAGAWKGQPFDDVEVLGGKLQRSKGDHKHTILFGKCSVLANRNNPSIKHAIELPGCPPDIDSVIKALRDAGISADVSSYEAYRRSIYERYKPEDGFDESLYVVG